MPPSSLKNRATALATPLLVALAACSSPEEREVPRKPTMVTVQAAEIEDRVDRLLNQRDEKWTERMKIVTRLSKLSLGENLSPSQKKLIEIAITEVEREDEIALKETLRKLAAEEHTELKSIATEALEQIDFAFSD